MYSTFSHTCSHADGAGGAAGAAFKAFRLRVPTITGVRSMKPPSRQTKYSRVVFVGTIHNVRSNADRTVVFNAKWNDTAASKACKHLFEQM